jgi:GTP-binding protein EngB required for normal cell division
MGRTPDRGEPPAGDPKQNGVRKPAYRPIEETISDLLRRRWLEDEPGEACFDSDARRTGLLLSFLDAKLSSQEAAGVRDHLIMCPRCRFIYARLCEELNLPPGPAALVPAKAAAEPESIRNRARHTHNQRRTMATVRGRKHRKAMSVDRDCGGPTGMRDEPNDVGKIRVWFERSARPFLEKVQPEKVVADLVRDLEKLIAVEKRLPTEMTVCFLGNSGVGKSTLINALVGGSTILLPAGGIGPLTAQALTVRHGKEPRFEVEYHPFQNLWRLIFGLEQTHKEELQPPGARPDAKGADTPPFEDEQEQPVEADADPADATAGRSAYRKVAQLLVTGGQDNHTELAYLADCLREAAGKPRAWGTRTKEEDRERITAIREALDLAKGGQARVCRGSAQDRSFFKELRHHASGFLAPLIKDLNVYWDAELLADGMTLVDLPGVGISGDVYRGVTRKWVREKAEAVVLVVDHRGVTESVADLLRKSEFLNRLIHSADDPTSDPVLMVVIAKVDDIADSRFGEDPDRTKREHFADVCAASVPTIQEQVRRQIEAVWSSSEGAGETRRRVLDNILSTLQVHPLSAIQFRKALAGRDDDPPFLRDVELSNVPRFQQCLRELAKKRKAEHHKRLQELRGIFLDRVLSILRVTQAQWEEETRASEEAERLRKDLAVFMEPLHKDLYVRQGQYRAFLKKNIPQRICDLVQASMGKAQTEIRNYLTSLGYAHWGTLRASVCRGGRFSGTTREIDLPREFALRVEEPIAEAWSKQILNDLRRETKDYAGDCVKLVERVVAWAKEQGARVKPRLVEAQYDAIKVDAAKLATVGKEMVNELRDEVKNQLIEAVSGPIREGCQAFVTRNEHVGAGVKWRILHLYASLAQEVTTTALEPATTMLTRLFREVEKEISAAFENHEDPLAAAEEAIVTSQENYLKRSDAQKRKRVLDELGGVLAACPAATDSEGCSQGKEAE